MSFGEFSYKQASEFNPQKKARDGMHESFKKKPHDHAADIGK